MRTLRDAAAEASRCTRCRLARGRTQVVYRTGHPDADLMFIGEGPGFHEDKQGEPFVGAAGQLLNRMLGEIGLVRDQVYIANIVKCRPPGNRDPRPDEIEACTPWLVEQISLIQPPRSAGSTSSSAATRDLASAASAACAGGDGSASSAVASEPRRRTTSIIARAASSWLEMSGPYARSRVSARCRYPASPVRSASASRLSDVTAFGAGVAPSKISWVRKRRSGLSAAAK